MSKAIETVARYILAGMKTAKLNPANPQDAQYFTGLLNQVMAEIPPAQRERLTADRWKRFIDLAVDTHINSETQPGMEAIGYANSPAHVWDRTEFGQSGKQRREATRKHAQELDQRAAPDRGDTFTPEGSPTVRDTFTQDAEPRQADKFKPLSNDPSELWKQAKQKGQV